MNITAAIKGSRILLSCIMLFGVFVFCAWSKKTWGVFFSLFVFCTLLALARWGYYYNIILPFGVFPLIAAVAFCKDKIYFSKRFITVIGILCVIGSTIVSLNYDRLENASVFVSNDKFRQEYYNMSQLVATVKKPKIMFYHHDNGNGVLADALPACKYWGKQNGATSAMIKERDIALRERKADFLFMDVPPTEFKLSGYVYCGNTLDYWPDGHVYVYCKKELYRKLPPVKLRTIDLLLKRNLLCKDED